MQYCFTCGHGGVLSGWSGNDRFHGRILNRLQVPYGECHELCYILRMSRLNNDLDPKTQTEKRMGKGFMS